jgi:hypothetical protein
MPWAAFAYSASEPILPECPARGLTGRAAFGALQPVADHAAYGRRCPVRNLRGRRGNWLSWVALRPRVAKD